MADIKTAILDARYIDMISLADFIVRDCGLPDVDADGNYLPQATDIAASVFRWAADAGSDKQDAPVEEYDENGDPIMDAEEAARLEAARKGKDGSD